MSSINNQKALYICSLEDANQVFASTEENFAIRISHLEQDGLASDIRKDLDTLAKIDEYIQRKYPYGLDRLYFRAHGNRMTCVLNSKIPGGKISVHLHAENMVILKRICQAVKPGGLLITESCHNGKGKDNLLKFLAQFCHPFVVVIGNRGDVCEVEFYPRQPTHHRFVCDGRDFSRIYFQTSAKSPVNISIRKLNTLQKLLGKTEGGLKASYQFLGERKCQPDRAYEVLKEALKMVSISRADVSEEWQEILFAFASDLKWLEIHPAYRLEDLHLRSDGDISNIYRPSNKKEQAYLFLLGMAILEEHQEIFALLEGGKTPYGPLAQCIHALSNLAVHDPKGRKSILEMLDQHWSLIKHSYRLAVENNLLSTWAQALIDTNDPCTNAYIDALSLFCEEAILNGCTYPADDGVRFRSRISVKKREDLVEKAAEENELEALEFWLSSGKISRYARGNAVLLATLHGNKECLKCLLRSGEIPDFYRGIAAMIAKIKQYSEMLKYLKRSGDFLECHKENLALLSLSSIDDVPFRSILLAKRHTKAQRSQLVRNCLIDRDEKLLLYLVASGEIEDDLRNRLVVTMAKEGKLFTLEVLLDSGPIARWARNDAIELAANKGHKAVLKKLLNTAEFPSPLVIYVAVKEAMEKRRIDLIKPLLKSGQLSRSMAEDLLISMAEISDDPEIANLLVFDSVSLKVREKAFHVAMKREHKNFANVLIEKRLLDEMRLLSVRKREREVKIASVGLDRRKLQHLLISGEISNLARGFALLGAAYIGNRENVQILLDSGDIPNYHRAFAAMVAKEGLLVGREGSFEDTLNFLLPPGKVPEVHRLASEIWSEKGERDLPTFNFQYAGDETKKERDSQVRFYVKKKNTMHLRLELASGEISEDVRDEMIRKATENGDEKIVKILREYGQC